MEKHHIIPKCLIKRKTPSIINGKWNIIPLTPREHFICHKLLYKIARKTYGMNHKITRKMVFALHRMSNSKQYNTKIISGRDYTTIREKYVDSISKENNPMWGLTGKEHPAYGYKWDDERRNEYSQRMKTNNPNHNTAPWNKGKTRPEMIGELNPAVSMRKNYEITFDCGKSIRVTGLKKFCREHGYDSTLVGGVRTGKRKYHKNIIAVEIID